MPRRSPLSIVAGATAMHAAPHHACQPDSAHPTQRPWLSLRAVPPMLCAVSVVSTTDLHRCAAAYAGPDAVNTCPCVHVFIR